MTLTTGGRTVEESRDIAVVLEAAGIDLLIADPQWVGKLAAGDRDDIRPCIRCNAMCVGNAFFALPLGCAVNPAVGFERERTLTPAAEKRHVIVVGGGPAGLEAARVAATRGHTVDLYEKTDRLGGVLFAAATPGFKKELRGMIGWWERQLATLPVTVHLSTEITAASPELTAADEIARDLILINRITLLRQLAEAGVRILTSRTVTGMDAAGLDATGPDGPVRVDADTVVAAFGARPSRALPDALEGRARVHVVGDCVTPAKVGDAINAAFVAALAI